jgi:hypothetical protein
MPAVNPHISPDQHYLLRVLLTRIGKDKDFRPQAKN